ncbi:MAG: SUMF1/EgtB/PvdO family nonheme iron enzyme [Kiritimatiellae bacterium]|nr:SUMF1/EgtB/PvdO family nonheme iron enzyme [Kiritimatiellia bacterium]
MPDGLWIGRYEVTKDQWHALVGAREFEDTTWEESPLPGNSPAHHISHDDAMWFVNMLNMLPPAQRFGLWFRLPTEGEWWYACQAGGSGRFGRLADGREADIDEVGWTWDNSGPGIHPVGTKQANAWGLFDMRGNLWEWTSDSEIRDGKRLFVQCGGSFGLTSAEHRKGHGDRWVSEPDFQADSFGFRVCAKRMLDLSEESGITGTPVVASASSSIQKIDHPSSCQADKESFPSSVWRKRLRRTFLEALKDANTNAAADYKRLGLQNPAQSTERRGAIMAQTFDYEGNPVTGYFASAFNNTGLFPDPEQNESVSAYYLIMAGNAKFGVPVEAAWEAIQRKVPCIAFDPSSNLTIRFCETHDGRYGYSRPREIGNGGLVWDPVDETSFGYKFDFTKEERELSLKMACGIAPELAKIKWSAGAVAAPTSVPVDNGVEWHNDSVFDN